MGKRTVSALVLAIAAGGVIAQPAPQPSEKKPEAVQPATPAKVDAPAPAKGEKKKSEAPAAPAPSLKVGDDAPAIKVDAWVKGEEVKSFEAGKVYIVEFWATWCPPCIAGITHLTKAQKDHPALTVIGVAASEYVTKPGEDGKAPQDKRLDALKEFVRRQGRNLEYRVAFDGDREMGREWMKAAGQNTIPCAFIIGHNGKVAYIGDPAKMDGELSKALKDAADNKKSAAE